MQVNNNTPATSELQSTGSLNRLSEDFDDFLTLLVTQLENQDPTSPLDTNEFTAQLVSFTEVEQSIATNSNLEKLITLNAQAQTSAVVGYTGKIVEAEGSLIDFNGTDNAVFSYELPATADNVFVTVRDLNGAIVFNGLGQKGAGQQNITWDGKNSDGEVVPAGIYQIQVTASMDGDLKEIPTIIVGKVTGVNLAGDEIKLIVNGEEIALDKVRFIVDQPEASPNAPKIAGFSNTATYNEGDPAVSIDDYLLVIDENSEFLEEATIKIVGLKNKEKEFLEVDTSGTNITATYDKKTGVLKLTGTESIEKYEQVLRSLKYRNDDTELGTQNRTISMVVSNGTLSSAEAKTTLSITGTEPDDE